MITIRRLVTLVISILLLSLTLTAQAFKEVYTVTGSNVSVKTMPNGSANTLLSLKRGEFLTVTAIDNQWATVETAKGTGFVNANFIGAAVSQIKVVSSKSGLVIKQKASMDAATLATLKNGMVIEELLSTKNGWSFVKYGNQIGYVNSRFIQTPVAKTMYVNSKSGVIVRSIASRSGKPVTSLGNNATVKSYSTIVGWTYISSEQYRGYVPANFLSTAKNNGYITASLIPPHAEDLNVLLDFYTNGKVTTKEAAIANRYSGVRFLDTKPFSTYFPLVYYDADDTAKNFIWTGQSANHGSDYHERAEYPLYRGKKWRINYYGYITQIYEVLSVEPLVTKAGTFKDVVKIRVTYDTISEVNDYYFAPNLGIIRQDQNGNILYVISKILPR